MNMGFEAPIAESFPLIIAAGFIFLAQISLGAVVGAYFGYRMLGLSPVRTAKRGAWVGTGICVLEAVWVTNGWWYPDWFLALAALNILGAIITYWLCRRLSGSASTPEDVSSQHDDGASIV